MDFVRTQKIESKTCVSIDLGKALLYKDFGAPRRGACLQRDAFWHMRRRPYGHMRSYGALDIINTCLN
jgi:hypothetical protein